MNTLSNPLQTWLPYLVCWLLQACMLPGCLLAGRAGTLAPAAPDLQGRLVVGYFPEWGIYARDYHVTNVPADFLTHLHYAFLRPVYDSNTSTARIEFADRFAALEKMYPGDSGTEPFQGNLNQLLILKRAHPHLKTLLSVGGDSLSRDFSDIAASATGRQTFAESCRDYMVQYGFDGVDINWEFPVEGGQTNVIHRLSDSTNQVLLLEQLRQVLDAQGSADGRDYLLTVTVSATKDTLEARYDFPRLGTSVDWINVMGYSMAGPWSPTTGHQAPLYGNPRSPTPDFHVADGILHLVRKGVPRDKLVLGVPFYGQGFQGVSSRQNGLFQSHSGASSQGTWSPGIFAYHDLRDGTYGHRYIDAQGFAAHWDPAAHAPFLFNPDTGVFITYENPRALRLKARFVRETDLRGIMCWSLESDTSDYALVRAVYDTLSAPEGAVLPPAGHVVWAINYDKDSPSWNYSYAYAGYGGSNFSDRVVSPSLLTNRYEITSLPGSSSSNILVVHGDFTAVPQPGSLTGDGFTVEWAYGAMGMGSGLFDFSASNLVSTLLKEYTFEFAATVPTGFLPGKSTVGGTWKLQFQAPDDTLYPPDPDSNADTLLALQGDFLALGGAMTTFSFRLDEVQISSGSVALLQQYHSQLRQININFDFWDALNKFGFDAGNTIALDNLVLRSARPILFIAVDPATGGLILSWEGEGQLQQGSRVDGDFVTIESARSPFQLSPPAAPTFFRVWVPDFE